MSKYPQLLTRSIRKQDFSEASLSKLYSNPNNLYYWEIENGRRQNINPFYIIQDEKPIIFFMGGLIHINKKGEVRENTPTLFGLLEEWSGKNNDDNAPRIISFHEGNDVPVADNSNAINAFNQKGIIHPYAYQLLNDLILPASIAPPNDLSLPECAGGADEQTRELIIENIQRHFSRLNLIGYSVGTSFIQQLELVTLSQLEIYGLNACEIRQTMAALTALNIGMTSLPSAREDGFTQLHLYSFSDATSSSYLDLNFLHTEEETVFSHTEMGSSIVLTTQEAGDNLVRRIKIRPSSLFAQAGPLYNGEGLGSVDISGRHEEHGHKLFNYMNVFNIEESMDESTTFIFPSRPFAWPARRFLLDAIKSSKLGSIRDGRAIQAHFVNEELSQTGKQRTGQLFRQSQSLYDYAVREVMLSGNPQRANNAYHNLNILAQTTAFDRERALFQIDFLTKPDICSRKPTHAPAPVMPKIS